jgi:xylan 1,4-beta-xylosidase
MTRSTVQPFAGNINFNAQHSPMGAFMSFTCGHFATRGGIGVQIGKPANQDLYIGVKEGDRFADAPLKCLPFYHDAKSGAATAAAFQVEQAGPAELQTQPKLVSYALENITRHYGWATDRWTTPDFSFTVYTPFGPIPDPAIADHRSLANALRPAVVAELEIDNTNGTSTKTAIFAMNFNEPGWRPLKQTAGRVGFAQGREMGVLAEVVGSSDRSLSLFCRWTPDRGLKEAVAHLLGPCPGVCLEVAPGQKQTIRLAFGCHLPNIETTGIEGRYFYNRYFSSLEHVLTDALDQGDPEPAATRLDQELTDSHLSLDQQFLIAHATRSYYGSTQLLDVGGEPFWIVNEGEYCMMNTLDLSVDQVFWEMKYNPWVVRNLLDNFVRHYSYVDDVKVASSSRSASDEAARETSAAGRYMLAPGGISFTHDMGAHNNFSPAGQSSYELPDLTGCFSYMTAEQLCNWILIATTYAEATDDSDWVKRNQGTLVACLESMRRRCTDGTVGLDSSRCGTGSEITTYDSLDHSLAQSRSNLYLTVKAMAACEGLWRLFSGWLDMGHADLASSIRDTMSNKLHKHVGPDGVLPAVFEQDNPGFHSRILPAIEGLLYEHVWNPDDTRLQDPPNDLLHKHTIALLKDSERRNLFPDGGIKLSSTSNNSWMSKIALFQHVAREVFHLDNDPFIKDVFARADAAHVKWQTDGSGYWACSDQFVSGVAKGSRYYPRVITAALWLTGREANQHRQKAAH